MKGDKPENVLEGTTRRVFRFFYRQSEPVGVHDVQRSLGLSSPSVAQYHIAKLLKAGLLKEEGNGYTAEKMVFENMIRIRKTSLPLQTTYAVFFLTLLVILVIFMRPAQLSSLYVLAICITLAAFSISAFGAYQAATEHY